MSESLDRLKAVLADRYAIERETGSGGMATVYLAEDVKHHRKVALKVLKPELAAVVGAERFLTEIETTANLQHPHILPLFDSGEADSLLYYVMPYIEGESLRDRLEREHQLPVDEALSITQKVASALEYAHEQGVVHRDIKPANILLARGEPLVADFGIALAVGVAGGSRLTETGVGLGTPQYMSPEQATGDLSVTATADVYALGCVLYEMLVGEPPYTGATAQAVLGKIIAGRSNPLRAQRPLVPAHVEAAVAKAIESVPADRFSSARRFAEALGNPSFTVVGRGDIVAPGAGRAGRWAWPAVALLATGAALWGWLRPQPEDGVARTVIVLPASQRISTAGLGRYPLAISPDGRRVAYVAAHDGRSTLFTRDLSDRMPVLLDGTEGAHQPFFSPDGEWVGFFAERQMYRASIAGGAPITITAVPSQPTFGASWGPDGTIVFSAGGSLHRVSAAGGSSEPLDLLIAERGPRGADSTANPEGEPRWPHHLPDGHNALVSVPEGTVVVELGSGRARFLFDGTQARYVAPGYLVYNAGQERLRAVRFDPSSLDVVGAEVPAVEGVFRASGGGAAAFAVSETGTLAYLAGGFDRSLWLVDREGREERIGIDPRGYRWPRVAPDGRRVAVAVDPRPSELWLVDLERAVAEPLTTEGHHVDPAWAPDSERLVFSLDRDLHEISWRSIGRPRRISDRPLPQYMPSWSIDDVIIVSEPNPETGFDLVAIDAADGSARPFLVTPANEVVPSFSPDGRWLAYTSDASGRQEVYVTPFPGPGPRHTVSRDGGTDPTWSRSGGEIVYRGADRMWVVDVRTVPGFTAGTPRALFDPSPYDFSQSRNWDVLPDGRFVMVKSDPTMLRQIEVVQNFDVELQSRAPR